MKKVILCLLVSSLFITSCKKEQKQPETPTQEITKTTVAWTFRKFSPLDAESQQSLGGTLVDTFTNTVERSLTANIPAVVRKLL